MKLIKIGNLFVFCVGMQVKYHHNEVSQDHIDWLKETYGEGPFEVTYVKYVPTNAIGNVGHAQWLRLKNINNPAQNFSGAFFQPC